MQHRWPLHLLANHLCNILSESAPSIANLVPASSLLAAISKAYTLVPQQITGVSHFLDFCITTKSQALGMEGACLLIICVCTL